MHGAVVWYLGNIHHSVSVVGVQVSCRCTARSFINVCTRFKGADCQTPHLSVYKGGRKL